MPLRIILVRRGILGYLDNMFNNYIDRKVDERLKVILGDAVKENVDRYARDMLRGGAIAGDVSTIATQPGSPYVLYHYSPRTPCLVGGYVDLFGMDGGDIVQVKIELKLPGAEKWRVYFKEELKGIQEQPLFNFMEVMVIGSIRITLTHVSGSGKKFYHVWYRRK